MLCEEFGEFLPHTPTVYGVVEKLDPSRVMQRFATVQALHVSRNANV